MAGLLELGERVGGAGVEGAGIGGSGGGGRHRWVSLGPGRGSGVMLEAGGPGGRAATIAAMVLWNPFRRKRVGEAADRFRRHHSLWLSRAVLTGRDYPRIPTRPVARGGYDARAKRPGGSERAAAWWTGAMARVDEI
ncbi:MAG: hypothetical protein DHS20C14_17590 [Phycisphaeraceae bacterium]|nr:MAG: hypothetical protein DHS20C14_17590 [Phycisphaeraceae bacterium]